MAIPYGRQSIDDADVQAVVDVLRSDWLTIGPKVAEFEQAVARVAGNPDATVVSSGTAALHAAYVGVGLKPGDEVITTPLTFVATSATAMAEGATVVFADVQEDTGNIDPAAVSALISERTAVVSAVDFGGHPADLDDLLEIARGSGARLLEDAAHSIGGTYRGRPVGSIADVTAFSFFPTKNMTSGEGGGVSSSDSAVVERAPEVPLPWHHARPRRTAPSGRGAVASRGAPRSASTTGCPTCSAPSASPRSRGSPTSRRSAPPSSTGTARVLPIWANFACR